MQKIISALQCARICANQHNKIKRIEDFDRYIAEIAYSRNIEVQGMQYPYAVAKVLNYDAIKLQEKLYKQTEYFERRIDALHRRASLHKGEICGHRARAEITGIITVLNALGYEVKMNWDLWCAECVIIPAEDFAKSLEVK
ncbi:MAG: hypothetical protein IKC27_03010 [Kiritimatiellae bacterium]|nr:hypothetical protein [Kiritimatiellia bacterium]